MAHECPECWQQCYCDQDDTGGMPVPDEHWEDRECCTDDDDYDYGCTDDDNYDDYDYGDE